MIKTNIKILIFFIDERLMSNALRFGEEMRELQLNFTSIEVAKNIKIAGDCDNALIQNRS